MLQTRCPPKVNLYLEIKGRRPDGYHELCTLFHTISGGDTLCVESAEALSLVCSDPSIPSGEENLVLRAARELVSECGLKQAGARFQLQKEIPAGAGLGGGSSNAAGALRLLNRLWNLELPDETLSRIALRVGADVPFFLLGGAASGQGVGEQLEPVESLHLHLVLIAPPVGVGTPWAYRQWNGAAAAPVTLDRFLLRARSGMPLTGDVLRNDLEPGVLRGVPEVAAARDWLMAAGAAGAMMTGSGSVVMGFSRDAGDAARIAAAPGAPGKVWVAQTVDRQVASAS